MTVEHSGRHTPKPIPAFDTPLEIGVIDGEVVITGPDGLCGSFTIEAAKRSAQAIMIAIDTIKRDG